MHEFRLLCASTGWHCLPKTHKSCFGSSARLQCSFLTANPHRLITRQGLITQKRSNIFLHAILEGFQDCDLLWDTLYRKHKYKVKGYRPQREVLQIGCHASVSLGPSSCICRDCLPLLQLCAHFNAKCIRFVDDVVRRSFDHDVRALCNLIIMLRASVSYTSFIDSKSFKFKISVVFCVIHGDFVFADQDVILQ